MKFTMPRRANKHKKQRVRRKTKIRWQQLGFTGPAEEQSSVSMETIRRQVVMMSSTGLEKAVRASRPPASSATPLTNDPSRRSRGDRQDPRPSGLAHP